MSFRKLIEKRRSHYALNDTLPITENEVRDIVKHALLHVPSAFNSQSARAILLFQAEHRKLWDMTRSGLLEVVHKQDAEITNNKMDSFRAAAGTLLFFEEQSIIDSLIEKVPFYSTHFRNWSEQSSGMLQYVIWTRFAEHNVGATLQHYNDIISEKVRLYFDIPNTWRLIAQMPFGGIAGQPKPKDFGPVDHRFMVFS